MHHDALFEANHYDLESRQGEPDYLKGLYGTETIDAPWQLWIFREPGLVRINVAAPYDTPGMYSPEFDEYQEARRLFPEALDVVVFTYYDREAKTPAASAGN